MGPGQADSGEQKGQAEKILVGKILPFDLPWDAEEKESTWLDAAEDLLAGIKHSFFGRWQEVLAIETVLGEAAEDGRNGRTWLYRSYGNGSPTQRRTSIWWATPSAKNRRPCYSMVRRSAP